jgi:hypothetical protein
MTEHRTTQTRLRSGVVERLGYAVAAVWLSCWTLSGVAHVAGVLTVREFMLWTMVGCGALVISGSLLERAES